MASAVDSRLAYARLSAVATASRLPTANRGSNNSYTTSWDTTNWRWHLDEVFVRINGKTCYLWRAVDHEGEVLEVFATKRRDRRAALRFLKRAMKRYGRPASIVTDGLPSYRAAVTVIGNAAARTGGRWLNNRAENSHQPFRRREAAMANFRNVKTLQKFASVHASIHNHFSHERHLNRRDIFKRARAPALAEWRQLAA